MGHLFWLSDEQWAVIELLLPRNKVGARRVDDRRGKRLGRPPELTSAQVQSAKRKLASKEIRLDELAALYDVHPWTLTGDVSKFDNNLHRHYGHFLRMLDFRLVRVSRV